MADRVIHYMRNTHGNYDTVIAEIDGTRVEAKRHGEDLWDVRTMNSPSPRLHNVHRKLHAILQAFDEATLPPDA